MIKYDDHRIFIIGGDQDGVITNQTWIVDQLDDFIISEGIIMRQFWLKPRQISRWR